MKKKFQHILNQVNLEINAGSESQAFAIREKIEILLKSQLLPEMENLFDQITPEDEVLRLDSVNLEVNLWPTEDTEKLTSRIVGQLHQKLLEAENEAHTFSRMNEEKILSEPDFGNEQDPELSHREYFRQQKILVGNISDLKNTLLYFLECGQLPWYANHLLFEEFIQSEHLIAELKNVGFVTWLKRLFSNNETALVRFLRQFDQPVVFELIQQITDYRTFSLFKQIASTQKLDDKLKTQIYKIALQKILIPELTVTKEEWHLLQTEINNSRVSKTEKENLIRQISGILNPEQLTSLPGTKKALNLPDPETRINSESSKPGDSAAAEAQPKKKPEYESIYIQNAGLILAHPFLWDFLTRTNCTDGKSGLLSDRREYAVHLLHYLSDFQEQDLEYNLAFEKFLCGIPADIPLTRRIELSEQDKNECLDLLLSIIKHWDALKKTSPESLQQLFLRRNGKLELKQTKHKLYVERKAQDILLNKLPWNISMVKLPWLNEIIFVEW